MSALIVASLILVITMLLTVARFGPHVFKRMLGYAAIVDVLFTVLMFMMFAGTFSGIVAGAFAGLFMTGLLYILRGVMGYERLVWRKWRFVWCSFPPRTAGWGNKVKGVFV